MIRKLHSTGYMLKSEAASANFGGWEAGVFRPRQAARQHRKAMDVFKRSSPEVPLNALRAPKSALRWDDDGAA